MSAMDEAKRRDELVRRGDVLDEILKWRLESGPISTIVYDKVKEMPAAGSDPQLKELVQTAFNNALEIGSDNWDSYLAGCRWPQLNEDPAYQSLITRLSGASA